jgi:hypothetical protein
VLWFRVLKMGTLVQPILLDQNFSPITQRYRYERLRGPRSFRLLRVAGVGSILSCKVECFELENSPAYNALSYTWGSPLYQPLAQSSRDTDPDHQFDIVLLSVMVR